MICKYENEISEIESMIAALGNKDSDPVVCQLREQKVHLLKLIARHRTPTVIVAAPNSQCESQLGATNETDDHSS